MYAYYAKHKVWTGFFVFAYKIGIVFLNKRIAATIYTIYKKIKVLLKKVFSLFPCKYPLVNGCLLNHFLALKLIDNLVNALLQFVLRYRLKQVF